MYGENVRVYGLRSKAKQSWIYIRSERTRVNKGVTDELLVFGLNRFSCPTNAHIYVCPVSMEKGAAEPPHRRLTKP
jgi:hypothetical protein